MKLPPHAFTTYWAVHAWAGVGVSLLVNAMFFTGVFTLFRDEIIAWQDPRGHSVAACAPLSLDRLAAAGGVDRAATDAVGFEVSGLDVACAPVTVRVRGRDEAGAPTTTETLVDRRSGRALPTRSVVGAFLFYFHFLYEPSTLGTYGMWIAGLVGVALLVVLVTGALLHLKDVGRQLHRLRAASRPRWLWSDVHKVVGLMGLPFQTLMVATGAMVCLATPIMSVYAAAFFDGDVGATRAAFLEVHDAREPAGEPAEARSLDALVAAARDAAPGLEPRYVRVAWPGDAASTARIAGRVPRLYGDADVTLSAVSGEVVSAVGPDRERAIRATQRWIYGFHFAWYGGLAARVIYALLGLLGCATILSGNWIWLERRDPRRAHAGHRVLGRLTVGLGLGIALAVGAMFLLNRLAPIDLAWHAWAEVAGFGVGWLVAVGVAFHAPSELRAAARVLGLAGAAFAGAPLLGLARTPLHLPAAIAGGADAVSLVDGGLLTFAALALALAVGARQAARARELDR